MKAKSLRLNQICNNKRLVQLFNMKLNPKWEEKTTFADMESFQQQGLVFKFLFVPKLVLNNVCYLADVATSIPTLYSWSNPAYVMLLPLVVIKKRVLSWAMGPVFLFTGFFGPPLIIPFSFGRLITTTTPTTTIIIKLLIHFCLFHKQNYCLLIYHY